MNRRLFLKVSAFLATTPLFGEHLTFSREAIDVPELNNIGINGMGFSEKGDIVYRMHNDGIHKYKLSTPWDMSTDVYFGKVEDDRSID